MFYHVEIQAIDTLQSLPQTESFVVYFNEKPNKSTLRSFNAQVDL